MSVIIDSDGLFNTEYNISDDNSTDDNVIHLTNDIDSSINLYELYYLALRSSMYFCNDNTNPYDNNVIKLFRENCAVHAWLYVANHMREEPYLHVDFLSAAREVILDFLKNDSPEASKIQLLLSMQSNISAKVVDTSTIVFPLLSRVMLNHYNLSVINSISEVIDDDGKVVGNIDRQTLARVTIPYFLFCHDNISVRNLPMITADSKDAVMSAFSFTHLQMIFILAHEYGHILLNHMNSDKELIVKENEADSFALQVLTDYVEKEENTFTKHDVYIAIRWLFKFQFIETIVGKLSQGKSIELNKSSLEVRRGIFQKELFEKYSKVGSSMFEITGFFAICELQDVLYEHGIGFIDKIIKAFKESKGTNTVEPWWEEIQNKGEQ